MSKDTGKLTTGLVAAPSRIYRGYDKASSVPPSTKPRAKPRSSAAERGRPDDPPTVPVTAKNGATGYVHKECLPFWKKAHGDTPALGDGMGAHR